MFTFMGGSPEQEMKLLKQWFFDHDTEITEAYRLVEDARDKSARVRDLYYIVQDQEKRAKEVAKVMMED